MYGVYTTPEGVAQDAVFFRFRYPYPIGAQKNNASNRVVFRGIAARLTQKKAKITCIILDECPKRGKNSLVFKIGIL